MLGIARTVLRPLLVFISRIFWHPAPHLSLTTANLLHAKFLEYSMYSVFTFFVNHFYCRGKHWSHSSINIQYHVNCRSVWVKESPPTNFESLTREPHKYFDHVIINVRSGDGGHGAVLSIPNQRKPSNSQGKHEDKTKRKGSYKRDSDGSLILPMGGHGGDVVIFADVSKESLLEFHKKRRYSAKRGGNVDAMGTLTSHLHDGFAAPALRIPVPVGLWLAL